MSFSKPQITIHGFKSDEVLEINAENLYSASQIFGQKMREQTLETLNFNLKSGKKREMSQCKNELELLQRLSDEESLAVGKINYTQRYLDSLSGFAHGANISILEASFLQKETETGCQTIITRTKNGDIAFMHTEENDKDDGASNDYNYRLVKFILPEKETLFFAYPGVCGWGPAFGIDKTNDYIQLVDDLVIDGKFDGLIWSNAVTSMLFDTGDIETAKELLVKIKKIGRKYGFFGGYAVHMIQNNILTNFSSEFGGKIVEEIQPLKSFFVQVNYAKSPELRAITEFSRPNSLKKWSASKKMDYLEMTRREERLLNICRMGWWDTSNLSNTINTGLKVLAYPYGDLRRYKGKYRKIKYYHTGLPSKWTFAHVVGIIGKNNNIYIGKNTPPKIPDFEYSIEVDENYKYQEEKLWEKV